MRQSITRSTVLMCSAALVLTMTVGTAHAMDDDAKKDRTGAYLAGTVGWGFWDVDEGSTQDALVSGGIISPFSGDFRTGDDDDVIWGAFVGYQFCDYFGLEAGYLDLGGFDGATGFRDRGGIPSRSKAEAEVTGWQLAARGNIPIPSNGDSLSVVVGAGVLAYELEYESNTGGSIDSEDVTATVSAGLQWEPCDFGGIRFEYEHFFDIDDQALHAVMLSLLFRWENLIDN